MPQILIIEDEKVLGEMYKEKFEAEGFQAFLVFSSEEAIETLKEIKPDLILLDILLPRENGIQFLKRIKEIPGVSQILVVAFSNYDVPSAKQEALESGAMDYLIKTDYTPAQLIKKIKEYLSK